MAIGRTNKEVEQGATMVIPDRHYHESVSPQSSVAATVLAAFFGLICCFLLVVGAIQAFSQVALAGVILVYIAAIGIPLLALAAVAGMIWRGWYMARIKKRHAEADLKAKEDQMEAEKELAEAEAERVRAEARRIDAEAEVMRVTVNFDEQGNAALRNPHTWQVIQLTGNMREHPTLHSLNYHNSISGAKAEESKVIVTPVITFPEPRNFADILTRWRPGEQGIFLLNTLQGDITVPIKDVCHVGLGGPTGGGKTNTTRLLIAQMLASGATVYLASPNYAPVKLNGNHLEDWRPITAYLKEPPSREPHEIENLLHRFIELLDRRRANEQVSPKRGKDVILALGEWPAIVAMIDDAPELLGRLLREARQYGIHIIAEFQDALINTIGGNSGVRENYRTAYYFGGDQKTAKILLDLDNKMKIDESGLGELGAAYLRSKANTACPGRVPWLSNQALYMLLGRPIDPVTDDTILDESEVPEAFQPYVIGDSRETPVPENRNTSPLLRNGQEQLEKPFYEDVPTVPQALLAKRAIVPSQEREQIIRLAKIGVSRRDMCAALGKGKHYYEIVKQVLDEEGL